MSSSAFDPLLLLSRNNGDPLAFDDNGGGGTTARLAAELPATGIYVILATPFAVNATGSYTLSLSRTTSFAPETDAGDETIALPGRPLLLKRLDPEQFDDTRFDRFAARRVMTK